MFVVSSGHGGVVASNLLYFDGMYYKLHGSHMQVTCRSHESHMKHAGHMQVTCRSHAGHMQVTCRSHGCTCAMFPLCSP